MKRILSGKHSSLFDQSISVEEKSFITMIPFVNFLKLFSSSLNLWSNKLECLQPSLIFAKKARSGRYHPPGRLQPYPETSDETKRVTSNKHSSISVLSLDDKRQNKLECLMFVSVKSFKPSLMFVGKEQEVGKRHAELTRIVWDKHSSLIIRSISDNETKLAKTDTCNRFYKTLCDPNL
jgi:hypothetical protein